MRVIFFTLFLAIQMQGFSQWDEWLLPQGNPSIVSWLDSNSAHISMTGMDRFFEDYGTSNYDIPYYGSCSFPINDSVFIGTGEKVLFHFRKSGFLETFDSISGIRPQDESAQYIEHYLINSSFEKWLYFYRLPDKTLVTRLTNDQGENWSTIPNFIEINVVDEFSEYFFQNFTFRKSGDRRWIYFGKTPQFLYRSDDEGSTWTKITLPNWLKPAPYNSFDFADENNGLMSCFNDGKLAYTNDGGVTWFVDGFQRPNNQNSYIAYAPPSPLKEGVFFIYGSNGCDYSSSNGLWWHNLDQLPHKLISFYDAEHGISLYEKNLSEYGIRYFTGTLKTTIKKNQVSFIKVYPNPAASAISFDLNSPASIQVFNSIGEIKATLDAPIGTSTMDISSLLPGVYYIKVEGIDKPIKVLFL